MENCIFLCGNNFDLRQSRLTLIRHHIISLQFTIQFFLLSALQTRLSAHLISVLNI